MISLRPPKQLTTALTLGAALLLQAPAWAQAPAELAPADTAVFVHINEPADWFGDLTQGPLGEKMRTMIQEGEGSGDLLAALGMNVDQFMDAYFGSDVVVLSQGENKPGVIFTKVAQDDRAHAIESLALKQQGDVAGSPLYVGTDGDGYIVMMDNWVALCDLQAFDYLTSILSQPDNAPRLINTDHYAKWTAELPADRAMTMLAFESKESQHALGVVRKGKGLDATYLGTSPDYDEMMAMLGETTVAEFGPLPQDTISAITFNIEPSEKSRPGMDKLNVLLDGKSFVDEVLPKLDPPTVFFMGSVNGMDVQPAVGVVVPVAGMAFKMNDASAVAELDRMFDNVVMLSNVAVMGFEAGLIPQRTETYGGATFKVAELGKPIAQGLEFPELAPIQIVYGQVGDYYVACSQEQFFKQCVDANKAGKAMRMEIEGQPHRLAKTPVLAMTARPDRFGAMLLSWAKMLEAKGLPEAVAGEDQDPIQIDRVMDMVQVLQQYSLTKLQVWTGEDGLVIGRAQLTAPQ